MRLKEIRFEEVGILLNILEVSMKYNKERFANIYLFIDPAICETLDYHRRATSLTKSLELTDLKPSDFNDPGYIKNRLKRQLDGLYSIKNLK